MRSSRAVVMLAIAILVLATAILLPGACGETAEQTELKAYTVWLEGRDARHEKILESIAQDRNSIESFVTDIPQLLESNQLGQLIQGAEAAQPALRRIRDEVGPAYTKFQRGLRDREVEAASILDLNDRLLAATGLYVAAVNRLGSVADHVDALVELGREQPDPARQEEVAKLSAELNRDLGAVLSPFASTVGEERQEILKLLNASLDGANPLTQKAAGLVRSDEEAWNGFYGELQVPDPNALKGSLMRAETEFLPAYRRLVAQARELTLPEGEARDAWKAMVEIFETRLKGLEGVPALRPKADRWMALVQESPDARAIRLAAKILEDFPGAVADLQQAVLDYQRFIEKFRKLRAEIL